MNVVEAFLHASAEEIHRYIVQRDVRPNTIIVYVVNVILSESKHGGMRIRTMAEN